MDYRKILDTERTPTVDYGDGDSAVDGLLEDLPPHTPDADVIEVLARKLGQVLVDLTAPPD